jgi:hypothetical protein
MRCTAPEAELDRVSAPEKREKQTPQAQDEEALSMYGKKISVAFPALLWLGLILGVGPALAGPTYVLLTTIPVPATPDNNVPGGKFTAYDISFFDANTQLYYLADRSNAAIDIFSAKTNALVGRIGGTGHLFVGIQPPPPSGQPANNDISGPDGVVVVNLPGQHQVWAGDGFSTLKGFDLNNSNAAIPNTPIATGNPPNPIPIPLPIMPQTNLGDKRVDEMAFDPKDNRLLVVNNAADIPFATLIDTSDKSNPKILTKVVFDGTKGTPNATGGAEQPVWDKGTQRFYISIPQIDGSGPGGVAVITADGTVEKTFNFGDPGTKDNPNPVFLGMGANCSPAGLAVGNGSRLVVGCGVASQTIILDPTANGGKGAITKIPQVSGADMVWFDPSTNRFFVAARLDPNGPVLGIIDGATGTWLQNVLTSAGAHSVAVDPVSGEVFVPFGGVTGNTLCPNGCIAVFGVPEPGSLLLLGAGLIGFGGLAWSRRHRS